MTQHHYADGIENITLHAGLIRIDYFQYEPADSAEAAPQHQVNDRLVMPPLAFVQAYQAMSSMIEKMEQEGIITRQTTPDTQATATAPPTTPPPPASSSPNFS